MAEFFRVYFVISYVSWPILLVLALREGAGEEEAHPKRYYWLLGLATLSVASAVLFGWCFWAFPVFPLVAILFFQAWWKLRRPLSSWEALIIVLLPLFAGLSLLPYRTSPLDIYDQENEHRLLRRATQIQKALDRYASESGGLYPRIIYGGEKKDDPLVPRYLQEYPLNPYYGLYRSPWFVVHNFCVFDWGRLGAIQAGFQKFDDRCRELNMGISNRMVNVAAIRTQGDKAIPVPGQDALPSPLAGNFEYLPTDFNEAGFATAYILKVYGPYWKAGDVVYSSKEAAEKQARQKPLPGEEEEE